MRHAGHAPLYERLNQPGRIEPPEIALQQRVMDSPAPAAASPGRWVVRAPLLCIGCHVARRSAL
jgi:hypothetical protein